MNKLPPAMQAKLAMAGLRGPRSLVMDRSTKKRDKVYVIADTGELAKAPKPKITTECKKNKMSAVLGLYLNWRDLMCRHIGLDLISEKAVGGDRGHIKNLLEFFGGRDKVFEAFELFISRWKDIKRKFSIAKNKDVPSLYLVDTLKGDLLAIMCGRSSLTGEAGGVHRADGQDALFGKSKEEIEAYFKGETK